MADADPAWTPRRYPAPLRLGILLSGSGRTLQNLLDRIADGNLPARIEVVVSSHPGVKGLERAAKAGIPTSVVDYRELKGADFHRAVTAALERTPIDLVVMAGFIRRWEFPDRYRGRVLNIHPALLPEFGGKGFWGHHVHEAVLASGAKESGCTVHVADLEYDRGPILLKRPVPVLPGDTPDALAARVFEAECAAYPEALRGFLEASPAGGPRR
jgi:phosphoribosylglycinamide formyltransferase 1